jgi:hypothetical protein
MAISRLMFDQKLDTVAYANCCMKLIITVYPCKLGTHMHLLEPYLVYK